MLQDVSIVCDGIEKFIKYDLTVNKNALNEFSRLFLKLLDRVLGEYTTGYINIIDSKNWVKGDNGGWMRVINRNTKCNSTSSNTTAATTNNNVPMTGSNVLNNMRARIATASNAIPTASSISSSTSITNVPPPDERLITLLSPDSILLDIFIFHYRQRECEMNIELLPQKIKAILNNSPLRNAFATQNTDHIGNILIPHCITKVSC